LGGVGAIPSSLRDAEVGLRSSYMQRRSEVANGIRLLATDNNRKGDLFARLMRDLFHALGYEVGRLNIQKTGREIDLEAAHRVERRRALAECKATADPVGGSELNKFAGVLDLERAKAGGVRTEGYFVSLAGYTESAIEQERELSLPRFMTLDASDVVSELIQGRVLISPERATEAAGRVASAKRELRLLGTPELLAHDLGWLWLCVFGRGREASHFTVVHADGQVLARSLAADVAAADEGVGGVLDGLVYLAPDDGGEEVVSDRSHARDRYLEHLTAELGDITLEGLPADHEAGGRRIPLEDLFVPMHLELADGRRKTETGGDEGGTELHEIEPTSDEDEPVRETVGAVLREATRVAVLAPPGGGKSTLLKRLAVAYASSDRRRLADDGLPDRNWFPLVIRCRHLGALARGSIRDALRSLPGRAEMPELEHPFDGFVAEALRSGEVLLLIDGLDEIADDQDRVTFAQQLRTFMATYPSTSLVVTSREAGFRAVAGVLASVCEHYRLAEFDDDDITSLTVSWHREVVGDTVTIRNEALHLAEAISLTDRVRRLARNPLLLTTLLLVKRWVGDLPRKRSVLYEKAIEVLLMTWNVEAHEPVDQEEAIPQLAFVAFEMTSEGEQAIPGPILGELLKAARDQMPEILGYARTPVHDFVKRVEDRSSVLVLTGHTMGDGGLVPTYEFRHLTFQEYLTAIAVAEGYYPGRQADDTVASILAPRIRNAQWREVIPLAAVRAGRRAAPLVELIVAAAEEDRARGEFPDPDEPDAESAQPVVLLGRCLADEVLLPPPLVERAAEVYGRSRRWFRTEELTGEILSSRYGGALASIVEQGFTSGDSDFTEFAGVYSDVVVELAGDIQLLDPEVLAGLREDIETQDSLGRTKAALLVMQAAFAARYSSLHSKLTEVGRHALEDCASGLAAMLDSHEAHESYAASWAFAWLGQLDTVPQEVRPRILHSLLRIWRESVSEDAQATAAWALAGIPLIDRSESPFGPSSPELERFVQSQYLTPEQGPLRREDRRPAALVVGYYLGAPWQDEELGHMAAQFRHQRVLPAVAKALGVGIADAAEHDETAR
jgi:energy-coupling factor transporter ATP-binding protein EcfA2